LAAKNALRSEKKNLATVPNQIASGVRGQLGLSAHQNAAQLPSVLVFLILISLAQKLAKKPKAVTPNVTANGDLGQLGPNVSVMEYEPPLETPPPQHLTGDHLVFLNNQPNLNFATGAQHRVPTPHGHRGLHVNAKASLSVSEPSMYLPLEIYKLHPVMKSPKNRNLVRHVLT
jgi:hypothetical protein